MSERTRRGLHLTLLRRPRPTPPNRNLTTRLTNPDMMKVAAVLLALALTVQQAAAHVTLSPNYGGAAGNYFAFDGACLRACVTHRERSAHTRPRPFVCIAAAAAAPPPLLPTLLTHTT